MKIFGNICVGFVALGAFFMLQIVSQSVSQYEFIVAIMYAMIWLVCYFALLVAITAMGKLDFLGWPRLLLYFGSVIASLSLTALTCLSAALRGSEGHDFPWSIQPFSPWAAVVIPLALALIGGLLVNSGRAGIANKQLVVPLAIIIAISFFSSITFAVEVQRLNARKAEEKARDDLAIVQQTDAKEDFSRLLMYSSRFERPATRQLALQKIVATGPQFDTLMIACLKSPSFEEGLKYLRDNDPPGDGAPLAEPARNAILLSAERVREEFGTGREMKADEIERRVDSALTVADKYSKYGVDFVPAVRDFRAAFDASRYGKLPASSIQKMDKWLAANSK